MSSSLNTLVRGEVDGDELSIEMSPDRIAGGVLATVAIGVRIVNKKPSSGSAAGCLAASGTATSKVSNSVSGQLSTAEMRRFLRWLADSLDSDTPTLNIEVTAEDGDTQTVQGPARRLAAQAFA